MTIANNSPAASTDRPALLLFAHGSAEPAWADPFRKLLARVQQRDPGRIVELAFLERMEPAFETAVLALQQRGVRAITVAPIFLAIGGHLRRDLPALVAEMAARTQIQFDILPALGEVDSLLDAIAGWLVPLAPSASPVGTAAKADAPLN